MAELGSITAEPTDPAPGVSRAHLLPRVDDDVAARFLDVATASESGSVAPLVTAQIRHLGGALARRVPDAGAAGRIEEDYLLYLFGSAYTPDQAADVRQQQAAISDALAPYTSGRTPFTLLARPQSAACAFPANVLARLRDVKRANDPLNVIRSTYSVLGSQR